MALFGKDKGNAPGNSGAANQNGDTPKKDDGAFDFDSIARDLEAQDGPSPFDDLLSKPVGDNFFDIEQLPSVDENASGSAFDFPTAPPEAKNDPPARTVVSSSNNGLDNLDDLFGAPSSPKSSAADVAVVSDSFPDIPLTTPSNKAKAATRPAAPTPVAAPEPAPTSPAPSAKKPLPLIPILGVLGVLVLGGAGWFFSQSGTPDTDTEDAVPIANPLASGVNKLPVEGALATLPTTAAAVQAPPTGAMSAPPGAPNVPATPNTIPPSSASAMRPPAPAMPSGALAAPSVDDPETLAQLRNLWEQGKSAKYRKDYAAAREFWQQALRIKPGHPGFQQSIDKLPKN